jgi:hypothetical protein
MPFDCNLVFMINKQQIRSKKQIQSNFLNVRSNFSACYITDNGLPQALLLGDFISTSDSKGNGFKSI